jgi:hypothetical protein
MMTNVTLCEELNLFQYELVPELVNILNLDFDVLQNYRQKQILFIITCN